MMKKIIFLLLIIGIAISNVNAAGFYMEGTVGQAVNVTEMDDNPAGMTPDFFLNCLKNGVDGVFPPALDSNGVIIRPMQWSLCTGIGNSMSHCIVSFN